MTTNTMSFPQSLGSFSNGTLPMKTPLTQARRSKVIMQATAGGNDEGPVVSGDKIVEPKQGHMDMMFLSQTYDHHRDMPSYAGNQFKEELMKNAKYLSTRGKGILASDESNSTCGKRLESAIGLPNGEENRRRWREVLYTTPDLGKYCVGAIMYDETVRQSTKDGKRFIDVLNEQGILAGVKADIGLSIIEGTDENYTMGLDGLGKRASEYY